MKYGRISSKVSSVRESQKVAVKPKPQKIDKIALIVRPESPELANACKEVIAIFERFGVEVCALESSVQALGLDPRLACKESELGERAQALVSLGGDGTLISAVRKSLGLGLPVLGINMGRLGFLTAIKPSELEEFVPLLKGGEYVLDSHHLLQGLLVDSALGEHSRVGFLAKNGDCCGEPAVITTQGNSLDSPCKAPFLAQKSCREQTELESTFENNAQNFQNLQSPTAIPRILEEENQAENETQTELESNFLDSSSLSLRADSSAWQSTHNAQKSKKVDSSMDCHADKSARNDDENTQSSNTPQAQAKLDSSKSPSDSKILDEKCGLQGKSQGSYLDGDLWDFSQLPHLSSKAESPQVDSRICDEKPLLFKPRKEIRLEVYRRSAAQKSKVYRAKPNPQTQKPTPNPFYVLNEILITKKDISGMIKIYATINNEHFHTYRADGLIIATPTGSSAYNISAGGSLVHPQCRVILLTPVCAHSLTQRPMIVSDNFCLQFSVEEDSMIMLDGQERIDFRKGDTLFVQGSFPIQLIQHPKRSYFAVLEEKFGLGGKQV